MTSSMTIGLRRSGLSVPYLRDRLVVGDAREFGRHRLAIGELLEHAAHHGLDGGKHVLLRDKAHFEIELIELARRAIGARIFVAEAGRDLEVAVEAGDHDAAA